MFVFFFNDTATTEIYTLSLHDALPIWRGSTVRTRRTRCRRRRPARHARAPRPRRLRDPKRREAEPRRPGRARRSRLGPRDRKSTRLNSSHDQISYAVFCLKKKKQYTRTQPSDGSWPPTARTGFSLYVTTKVSTTATRAPPTPRRSASRTS